MESEQIIKQYELFKNTNSKLRKYVAVESEVKEGKSVVQELKADVETLLKDAGRLTKKKNIGSEKYSYVIESIGQWRALFSYFDLKLESPRANEHKYYAITQRAKRRGIRPIRGIVVSDKMNKTITVRVDKTKIQRPTGKIIKRSKKYLVHDEYEVSKLEDTVLFFECRPFSKRKSHNLFCVA